MSSNELVRRRPGLPVDRRRLPLTLADGEWLHALQGDGPRHDAAVTKLRLAIERAARHQVAQMPQVRRALGSARAEEIVQSATNLAAVQVLDRLDRFEGRSRLTTWVYKFGVHHAHAEANRALWRGRSLPLPELDDPPSRDDLTPESFAEARDLAAATLMAMKTALTPLQRRVATALLVDQVPIDVLAERMGSSRNTLYKTLHDARTNLRAELARRGYLHVQEAVS